MNNITSKEFFDHLSEIYEPKDFIENISILFDKTATDDAKKKACEWLEIIYRIAVRFNI